MSDERPRTSNEAKFETRNPLVQRMIGGFFSNLREVVAPLEPATTLDAGCGEGETIARIGDVLGAGITAVDIDAGCVAATRRRLPGIEAGRGDVTDLDFAGGSFDLVLCLEVLEHVHEPSRAVAELARVARRDVVVSVPYEPWFRLGSLLRGKYVTSFGNHPEHVNHFNQAAIRTLLEPFLTVREVRSAFPWLIAAGRVRG